MDEIVQLIRDLGFPIAVAVALFWKNMKDGEQHKLLITIKSFPNHHPLHPEEVELLDIKELSDSDPLITALMATDY